MPPQHKTKKHHGTIRETDQKHKLPCEDEHNSPSTTGKQWKAVSVCIPLFKPQIITVFAVHMVEIISVLHLYRSTDPHMPAFPTLVHITNEHNHNLHVPDALRYKDVGPEAIQKLKKLFEAGHSPSTALDVLKYDLQLELGDDYAYASADRSICPDIQFCYR